MTVTRPPYGRVWVWTVSALLLGIAVRELLGCGLSGSGVSVTVSPAKYDHVTALASPSPPPVYRDL